MDPKAIKRIGGALALGDVAAVAFRQPATLDAAEMTLSHDQVIAPWETHDQMLWPDSLRDAQSGRTLRLVSPFKDQHLELRKPKTGETAAFRLQPFEILIVEALPANSPTSP